MVNKNSQLFRCFKVIHRCSRLECFVFFNSCRAQRAAIVSPPVKKGKTSWHSTRSRSRGSWSGRGSSTGSSGSGNAADLRKNLPSATLQYLFLVDEWWRPFHWHHCYTQSIRFLILYVRCFLFQRSGQPSGPRARADPSVPWERGKEAPAAEETLAGGKMRPLVGSSLVGENV